MRITSVFRSLPPYLGGKRRLAPLIFGLLARHLPAAAWRNSLFLDPMCGAGAIALAAKLHGFRVVAGDAATRATTVARALIENDSVRLSDTDIAGALSLSSSLPHCLKPEIPLNSRSASVLNALLSDAEAREEPSASLIRLLAIKSFLRCFPMSVTSASDVVHFTAGNFDRISSARISTYLNASQQFSSKGLMRTAEKINAGVFGGVGRAVAGDVLTTLKSQSADVVYLDPPYPGTTGYAGSYHTLDLLLGDQPEANSSVPDLRELLDSSSHIPVLVLSYGGPEASIKSLTDSISRHREVVEAVQVPYRHLPSISRKKGNSNEFIIFAINR